MGKERVKTMAMAIEGKEQKKDSENATDFPALAPPIFAVAASPIDPGDTPAGSGGSGTPPNSGSGQAAPPNTPGEGAGNASDPLLGLDDTQILEKSSQLLYSLLPPEFNLSADSNQVITLAGKSSPPTEMSSAVLAQTPDRKKSKGTLVFGMDPRWLRGPQPGGPLTNLPKMRLNPITGPASVGGANSTLAGKVDANLPWHIVVMVPGIITRYSSLFNDFFAEQDLAFQGLGSAFDPSKDEQKAKAEQKKKKKKKGEEAGGAQFPAPKMEHPDPYGLQEQNTRKTAQDEQEKSELTSTFEGRSNALKNTREMLTNLPFDALSGQLKQASTSLPKNPIRNPLGVPTLSEMKSQASPPNKDEVVQSVRQAADQAQSVLEAGAEGFETLAGKPTGEVVISKNNMRKKAGIQLPEENQKKDQSGDQQGLNTQKNTLKGVNLDMDKEPSFERDAYQTLATAYNQATTQAHIENGGGSFEQNSDPQGEGQETLSAQSPTAPEAEEAAGKGGITDPGGRPKMKATREYRKTELTQQKVAAKDQVNTKKEESADVLGANFGHHAIFPQLPVEALDIEGMGGKNMETELTEVAEHLAEVEALHAEKEAEKETHELTERERQYHERWEKRRSELDERERKLVQEGLTLDEDKAENERAEQKTHQQSHAQENSAISIDQKERSLKNRIRQLEDKIARKQGEQTKKQEKSQQSEKTDSGTQGDLAGLRKELAALKKELGSLQGKLSRNEGQESSNDAQGERLAQQEAQQKGQVSRLGGIEEDLDAKDETLNSDRAALEAEIAAGVPAEPTKSGGGGGGGGGGAAAPIDQAREEAVAAIMEEETCTRQEAEVIYDQRQAAQAAQEANAAAVETASDATLTAADTANTEAQINNEIFSQGVEVEGQATIANIATTSEVDSADALDTAEADAEKAKADGENEADNIMASAERKAANADEDEDTAGIIRDGKNRANAKIKSSENDARNIVTTGQETASTIISTGEADISTTTTEVAVTQDTAAAETTTQVAMQTDQATVEVSGIVTTGIETANELVVTPSLPERPALRTSLTPAEDLVPETPAEPVLREPLNAVPEIPAHEMLALEPTTEKAIKKEQETIVEVQDTIDQAQNELNAEIEFADSQPPTVAFTRRENTRAFKRLQEEDEAVESAIVTNEAANLVVEEQTAIEASNRGNYPGDEYDNYLQEENEVLETDTVETEPTQMSFSFPIVPGAALTETTGIETGPILNPEDFQLTSTGTIGAQTVVSEVETPQMEPVDPFVLEFRGVVSDQLEAATGRYQQVTREGIQGVEDTFRELDPAQARMVFDDPGMMEGVYDTLGQWGTMRVLDEMQVPLEDRIVKMVEMQGEVDPNSVLGLATVDAHPVEAMAVLVSPAALELLQTTIAVDEAGEQVLLTMIGGMDAPLELKQAAAEQLFPNDPAAMDAIENLASFNANEAAMEFKDAQGWFANDKEALFQSVEGMNEHQAALVKASYYKIYGSDMRDDAVGVMGEVFDGASYLNGSGINDFTLRLDARLSGVPGMQGAADLYTATNSNFWNEDPEPMLEVLRTSNWAEIETQLPNFTGNSDGILDIIGSEYGTDSHVYQRAYNYQQASLLSDKPEEAQEYIDQADALGFEHYLNQDTMLGPGHQGNYDPLARLSEVRGQEALAGQYYENEGERMELIQNYNLGLDFRYGIQTGNTLESDINDHIDNNWYQVDQRHANLLNARLQGDRVGETAALLKQGFSNNLDYHGISDLLAGPANWAGEYTQLGPEIQMQADFAVASGQMTQEQADDWAVDYQAQQQLKYDGLAGANMDLLEARFAEDYPDGFNALHGDPAELPEGLAPQVYQIHNSELYRALFYNLPMNRSDQVRTQFDQDGTLSDAQRLEYENRAFLDKDPSAIAGTFIGKSREEIELMVREVAPSMSPEEFIDSNTGFFGLNGGQASRLKLEAMGMPENYEDAMAQLDQYLANQQDGLASRMFGKDSMDIAMDRYNIAARSLGHAYGVAPIGDEAVVMDALGSMGIDVQMDLINQMNIDSTTGEFISAIDQNQRDQDMGTEIAATAAAVAITALAALATYGGSSATAPAMLQSTSRLLASRWGASLIPAVKGMASAGTRELLQPNDHTFNYWEVKATVTDMAASQIPFFEGEDFMKLPGLAGLGQSQYMPLRVLGNAVAGGLSNVGGEFYGHAFNEITNPGAMGNPDFISDLFTSYGDNGALLNFMVGATLMGGHKGIDFNSSYLSTVNHLEPADLDFILRHNTTGTLSPEISTNILQKIEVIDENQVAGLIENTQRITVETGKLLPDGTAETVEVFPPELAREIIARGEVLPPESINAMLSNMDQLPPFMSADMVGRMIDGQEELPAGFADSVIRNSTDLDVTQVNVLMNNMEVITPELALDLVSKTSGLEPYQISDLMARTGPMDRGTADALFENLNTNSQLNRGLIEQIYTNVEGMAGSQAGGLARYHTTQALEATFEADPRIDAEQLDVMKAYAVEPAAVSALLDKGMTAEDIAKYARNNPALYEGANNQGVEILANMYDGSPESIESVNQMIRDARTMGNLEAVHELVGAGMHQNSAMFADPELAADFTNFVTQDPQVTLLMTNLLHNGEGTDAAVLRFGEDAPFQVRQGQADGEGITPSTILDQSGNPVASVEADGSIMFRTDSGKLVRMDPATNALTEVDPLSFEAEMRITGDPLVKPTPTQVEADAKITEAAANIEDPALVEALRSVNRSDPDGTLKAVSQHPDGTFILTPPDGTIYRMDPGGTPIDVTTEFQASVINVTGDPHVLPTPHQTALEAEIRNLETYYSIAPETLEVMRRFNQTGVWAGRNPAEIADLVASGELDLVDIASRGITGIDYSPSGTFDPFRWNGPGETMGAVDLEAPRGPSDLPWNDPKMSMDQFVQDLEASGSGYTRAELELKFANGERFDPVSGAFVPSAVPQMQSMTDVKAIYGNEVAFQLADLADGQGWNQTQMAEMINLHGEQAFEVMEYLKDNNVFIDTELHTLGFHPNLVDQAHNLFSDSVMPHNQPTNPWQVPNNPGDIHTADYINMLYDMADKNEPYMPGTLVFDKVIPEGSTLYSAEYKGQARPGGWASNHQIRTIEELRRDLAVLEDWKDPGSARVVNRAYTVTQDLPVREGIIGPQEDIVETTDTWDDMIISNSQGYSETIYPGGAHQYEYMAGKWDDEKNPWWDYLKRVHIDILDMNIPR